MLVIFWIYFAGSFAPQACLGHNTRDLVIPGIPTAVGRRGISNVVYDNPFSTAINGMIA